MASKSVKTPLLTFVSKRNYAAQTQLKTAPVSGTSGEVKTAVLANKISVTSIGEVSPLSRISVFFRAGSRNETADSLGATHILRTATGLSTKEFTSFGIMRNIQQMGGNLCSSADREVLGYTLEVTHDNLENGLKYLGSVASEQLLNPWEICELPARMKFEMATVRPEVKLLELIHKASFRTGLGNSLYAPEYAIGNINSETLQHYIKCNFVPSQTAVVGQGVSLSDLQAFANNLKLSGNEGQAQKKSTFWGDELRIDTGSEVSYAAIATEGVSIQDVKQALSYAILQYCFGDGPATKWGISSGSLNSAVTKKAGNIPFAVSGLNLSFSDAGIIGFLVSAPSTDIGKVLESCMEVFRSGDVMDVDYERAKAQLRAAILYSAESGNALMRELGLQALLTGKVTSVQDLITTLDSIQPSDICAIAKKVQNGKLAMAAIGKSYHIPYISDFK